MYARLALLMLAPLAVAAYIARNHELGGAGYSIDDPLAWTFEPIDWSGISFAGAGELAGEPEPVAALDIGIATHGLELAGATLANAFNRAAGEMKKVFQLPARAEPYRASIAAAEAKYGIPESLLARVLHQESRYREDIITGATRSSVGAAGIAQFMPATARELGIDPLNPAQAIDGAGRYLRNLYRALGDWPATLAAYNWGIGNVQRKGMGAAPLETRNYVAQITRDVSV